MQVVQLVQNLLQHLDRDLRNDISVAFWDVEAALIASDRLSNSVTAIDDADPDSSTRLYSKAILVVGVPFGKVIFTPSATKVQAIALIRLAEGLPVVFFT